MLEGMPREVYRTLMKFVERMRSELGDCEVYVYGSYVKDTWVRGSDLDVVVVSDGFKGIPFMKRLDLMNRVSWELGEEPHVEAIPLTREELEERLRECVLVRDASKHWVKVYP